MNINTKYRFISALLCISILSGIVLPVFAYSGMLEHCSSMTEMPSDEHHNSMMTNVDMNSASMDHHANEKRADIDSCDMTFDCICDYTLNPIQKEALVIQQTKVPQLFISSFIAELIIDELGHFPPPLFYSNSYSPPLLFLANESLLI